MISERKMDEYDITDYDVAVLESFVRQQSLYEFASNTTDCERGRISQIELSAVRERLDTSTAIRGTDTHNPDTRRPK